MGRSLRVGIVSWMALGMVTAGCSAKGPFGPDSSSRDDDASNDDTPSGSTDSDLPGDRLFQGTTSTSTSGGIAVLVVKEDGTAEALMWTGAGEARFVGKLDASNRLRMTV